MQKEYISEDYHIKSEKFNIEIPFTIQELYLFLVEKNNGEILDYIEYGNYMTQRHHGVIIKTSRELIESVITQGENSRVELKREMSDEFLESV